MKECEKCKGKGKIMWYSKWAPCPECQGNGYKDEE